MKFRAPRKELSLLAGIIVAIIILVLWWLNRYTEPSHEAFFTLPGPEIFVEQLKRAVSLAGYY